MLVQLGNRFVSFVRTCDAKMHVPVGRCYFQRWAAEAPEMLRLVASHSVASRRIALLVPFDSLLVTRVNSR